MHRYSLNYCADYSVVYTMILGSQMQSKLLDYDDKVETVHQTGTYYHSMCLKHSGICNLTLIFSLIGEISTVQFVQSTAA